MWGRQDDATCGKSLIFHTVGRPEPRASALSGTDFQWIGVSSSCPVTISLVTPTAAVRTAVSAAAAELLHRLLPEGLQPFLVVVDIRGAPASHLARQGVISCLPARDNWDGSDPPRGCCANVSCATPPCPHRAAKRGGRSRPPPISPCGRRRSGIWP